MSRFLRILVILFSLSITITAQKVYVCESFTEDGEPIGVANNWSIKPWGTFLYIFLDSEGSSLEGNLIYLFVDKKEDNKYQPFDSKAINIDYDEKWIAYNYKFTLPGEYEIYFITADQKRIASSNVYIKYEETFTSSHRIVNSSYYDNCRIVFCEKILVGGEPLGVKRSMSLSSSDKSIYVLLNNYAPMRTSKFLVDVWRKKNRAFEYDEFVESKKYSLNPDWPDAFFKYEFKRTGDYKFLIYNEDEVLIKSAYFTVYD